MPPVPILYQSGYLTIKDYDEEFRTYILGFPNREVENGFIKFLLPSYTGMDGSEATPRKKAGEDRRELQL